MRKNILEIFDLCNILPKYKKYNDIDLLLKEHFKLLFDSEVYQDIKNIRKIANKIKHDKLDNNSIIQKYLNELLNLKTNIIESNEGHIRDF